VSRWSDAACDRLLADIRQRDDLTAEHDACARRAGVALGESVTIEGGREVFTVVGFELDGECVKLDDGKERFTIYAWRARRVTKGDGA
jgi:hypothetical protein